MLSNHAFVIIKLLLGSRFHFPFSHNASFKLTCPPRFLEWSPAAWSIQLDALTDKKMKKEPPHVTYMGFIHQGDPLESFG